MVIALDGTSMPARPLVPGQSGVNGPDGRICPPGITPAASGWIGAVREAKWGC